MGAVARGAYSFMSPISHSPVTLLTAAASTTVGPMDTLVSPAATAVEPLWLRTFHSESPVARGCCLFFVAPACGAFVSTVGANIVFLQERADG